MKFPILGVIFGLMFGVVLAGCASPNSQSAPMSEAEKQGLDTRVFTQEVPGYGHCTFLYATRHSNDGGVTLVGCK